MRSSEYPWTDETTPVEENNQNLKWVSKKNIENRTNIFQSELS